MKSEFPPIGVTVPTYDRRDLLISTLEAIVSQDYPGETEVVVVHDKSTPSPWHLEHYERLGVRWVPNTRTPGLPGARNSGVAELGQDIVAFCDDDDVWLPNKLRRQIEVWRDHPEANMVATSSVILTNGRLVPRLTPRVWIEHGQLIRNRMATLASSSFMLDRAFLLSIGGVAESAPRGQLEDWDLLLRASRSGPILNINEPLVEVNWDRSSYFTQHYESKVAGLRWILEQHPDIVRDRIGHARVLGKIAFWESSMQGRDARSMIEQTLKRNPAQWRGYAALLVESGALTPEQFLNGIGRFARGM